MPKVSKKLNERSALEICPDKFKSSARHNSLVAYWNEHAINIHKQVKSEILLADNISIDKIIALTKHYLKIVRHLIENLNMDINGSRYFDKKVIRDILSEVETRSFNSFQRIYVNTFPKEPGLAESLLLLIRQYGFNIKQYTPDAAANVLLGFGSSKSSALIVKYHRGETFDMLIKRSSQQILELLQTPQDGETTKMFVERINWKAESAAAILEKTESYPLKTVFFAKPKNSSAPLEVMPVSQPPEAELNYIGELFGLQG